MLTWEGVGHEGTDFDLERGGCLPLPTEGWGVILRRCGHEGAGAGGTLGIFLIPFPEQRFGSWGRLVLDDRRARVLRDCLWLEGVHEIQVVVELYGVKAIGETCAFASKKFGVHRR